MGKIDIDKKLETIANGNTTKAFLERPLVEWRPLLAKECQVYVFNESYIAKRFDQINYKFCSRDSAKEILIDNLYALLRFKYFPATNDLVEERIQEIIKSFTTNLKTTLIRVSFNDDEDCYKVNWIPNGCIAFRNGVYDFRNNKWLFKYDVIKIESLKNNLFMYDPQYIINWYVNINFEPLPINIRETDLKEFIEFMKEWDQSDKNYCFELLYNMCHDYNDRYSINRFKHLCEILGYLCYQSFSQKFVLLIGSGQNGKNSLIDGCFTDRIVPKPASNDIQSIENDKFITGALENKAHNIYLETTTSDSAYKDNTNLKALTGSQDQTIENKGENKYSGVINCKYIWSANDQDKVKFSDTTTGFRRRINVFEIWYHWDEQRRFLKHGDYYDTTFSEDLHELKNDINNIIIFIYFAMYGIQSATQDFTKTFNFTENDWKMQYTDIDFDLKDKIDNITPSKIFNWIKTPGNYELGKVLFYDMNNERLYNSPSLKEFGYNNYEDFLRFLKNEDDVMSYFVDNEVCISIQYLQKLIEDKDNSNSFTKNFKKAYGITQTYTNNNNRPYVKCRFINNKLKIS